MRVLIQTPDARTKSAAPSKPGLERWSDLSAWVRQTLALFAWSTTIAVLMSTELLFQPFVWRTRTLGDITNAWLEIARDRLIVALAIAAMLASLGQGVSPGPRWGPARTTLAVLLGSGLGELILFAAGVQDEREDILSILGRVLRWSVVGGAAAIMLHLWWSRSDLAAQAEEAKIEEAQARRVAASTQTEMLQRQIEPHFLFNILGTIRSLRDSDPEHGQRLLTRLLDYMSATMSCPSERQTTLGEEIELVLAYLDLCAFRMEGRLIVRCDAAPDLRARPYPPLMLATLAENAVRHGVFPRHGGMITISARLVAGMLEVAVADDGAGLTGETGHGLGLTNIAERLQLLYGPSAQLWLQENRPRGVRAVLRTPDLPARR